VYDFGCLPLLFLEGTRDAFSPDHEKRSTYYNHPPCCHIAGTVSSPGPVMDDTSKDSVPIYPMFFL